MAMCGHSEYISLKDACAFLSVSVATGKNWIKSGKLVPESGEGKVPVFKTETLRELKESIQNGSNSALKSRRNKNFVSGNYLYKSYVSEGLAAVTQIQKLLSLLEQRKIRLNSLEISTVIGFCAFLFVSERFDSDRRDFLTFLENKLPRDEKDSLVFDIFENTDAAADFVRQNPEIFSFHFEYVENEDILGLLYLSCKNLGQRKAAGAYYTPTRIAKRLISKLPINDDDTISDPCCGTGNFLLQLPNNVRFENVYGNDIDELSVKIARINMALKYKEMSCDIIRSHITRSDFLTEYEKKVSVIIGNPPWGYCFAREEKNILKDKYSTAGGANIESFAVFTEKALSCLKPGGILSFVLPQSVLNVKAHAGLRRVIADNNRISYLEFLGNKFDGVHCPCIILQIQRTDTKMTTKGLIINDGKREFCINIDREVGADGFDFMTTDEEYLLINKICNADNVVYLKGNADFALGIVSGNNKDFILKTKTQDSEIILKGSDIFKYRVRKSDNYIVFKPETLRQVAPVEMYRAKEKLLYRFISSRLVFAYDDTGMLSLNSCNIVIPKIRGLKMKYILAILNSRVAQFIFQKKYNSVKVLRSHIEAIPVPFVSESLQENLIKLVEPLISGLPAEEAKKKYDEADEFICRLYGLNKTETDMINRISDKFVY